MTIATATTINLSIHKFNIGNWLGDLLLPEDETQVAPSVESIIKAVSSWNAGEIADAIGSIIGAVCIDQYGEADTEAARLFSENRLIRNTIGLRRRSRLYTQRNLGKRNKALRALEEAIRIAEGVMMQRAMFRAQLGRYHEDIEDDMFFQRLLDDEELDQAETADLHYSRATSSSMDRRTKARQDEITLDKLNGTFRASRSGKRNSGVNSRDRVNSHAKNAFFRSDSMRRAYNLI